MQTHMNKFVRRFVHRLPVLQAIKQTDEIRIIPAPYPHVKCCMPSSKMAPDAQTIVSITIHDVSSLGLFPLVFSQFLSALYR